MRMYRSTTAIAKTKRFDRSSASDWHQHSISLTSKFHISMIRLSHVQFQNRTGFEMKRALDRRIKKPDSNPADISFLSLKRSSGTLVDWTDPVARQYNPFECEKSNDQIVNPRLSERAVLFFFFYSHTGPVLCAARNNFPKWELERIRLSLNFHLVYSAAARPMSS